MIRRPPISTRLPCTTLFLSDLSGQHDAQAVHGIVHLVGEIRSEEHTSELQSPVHLVCRLLLEKKKAYHDFRNSLSVFTTVVSKPSDNLAIVDGCLKAFSTDKLFSPFFFNNTATTEIYTLSLHDALPISGRSRPGRRGRPRPACGSARRPSSGARPARGRARWRAGRRPRTRRCARAARR